MSSCCGRNSGGTCCADKNGNDADRDKADPELRARAMEVVDEIMNKRKTILGVVEDIGPKLTDSNVDERLYGVNYLMEIVTRLPTDFLMSEEVGSLLTFFTARLQDSILLLTPTLKAIQFLLSCANLPDDIEKAVLASLFKEVNNQSGAHEDRYQVYQIIQFLLTSRMEGVKSMGIDFVLGFIQTMEGEKDPRCLVLVYDIFCNICQHVPLHHLSDDMFEIVACYFPIVFEPPPDDPYGITSEDLSQRLRRCLTAHPKFATLCMQLLEEQFGEDSARTKKETFLLMEEALGVFPPTVVAEWATVLWNEIRKQVMTPRNNELEELALRCLQRLVEGVANCTEEDGRNSNLVVLIGQLFRDCEPFLANPEMQLLEPTNRILTSASKGDIRVANQLASRVFPLYMEKYQNKATAKKEYCSLMLSWCRFLTEISVVAPIFDVRTALISLLLDDMLSPSNSSQVACSALEMATCLLDACDHGDDFLSNEHCVKIAHFAIETAAEADQASPASTFLRTLAKKRWSVVERDILPLVNSKIDNSSRFLTVLPPLVIDSISARIVLSIILQKMEFTASGLRRTMVDSVDALVLILELNESEVEGNQFGKRFRIVDGILGEDQWRQMCTTARTAAVQLAALVNPDELDKVENEKNENCVAFERICNLVQNLVLYGSDGFEKLILDELLLDMNVGNLPGVTPVSMLMYVERIVAAMTAKEIQARKISIYTPRLDSVDPQFRAFIRSRLARISACIINKIPADDLKEILDEILTDMESDKAAEIVEGYSWLCRALVLRNLQPYSDRTLSKLFDLLGSDNPDVAGASVNGLGVVLDDNPDAPLLSSRTGAQITLLAKQRTFSRAVTMLTDGFQSGRSNETKMRYFQALRIVLSAAPKNVQCEGEIEKLLPLLLNALQSDDQAVLASSVVSLTQLITNSTSASAQKLHSHVPMLSSRLVEIAKSKTSPMELRSNALDCVSAMAMEDRIPAYVLNPWRDHVLRQLMPCLGDKKRLVRAKAVNARNQWFVLG